MGRGVGCVCGGVGWGGSGEGVGRIGGGLGDVGWVCDAIGGGGVPVGGELDCGQREPLRKLKGAGKGGGAVGGLGGVNGAGVVGADPSGIGGAGSCPVGSSSGALGINEGIKKRGGVVGLGGGRAHVRIPAERGSGGAGHKRFNTGVFVQVKEGKGDVCAPHQGDQSRGEVGGRVGYMCALVAQEGTHGGVPAGFGLAGLGGHRGGRELAYRYLVPNVAALGVALGSPAGGCQSGVALEVGISVSGALGAKGHGVGSKGRLGGADPTEQGAEFGAGELVGVGGCGCGGGHCVGCVGCGWDHGFRVRPF